MSKEDPTKMFHSCTNVHVYRYTQTYRHTSLVNTTGGTKTLPEGQKGSGRCPVCFSSCSLHGVAEGGWGQLVGEHQLEEALKLEVCSWATQPQTRDSVEHNG